VRLAVLAAALAFAGALFVTPEVTAAGSTQPIDPASTARPALIRADDDPFPMDKTLAFTVSSITPEVVTSTGPTTLTVTGTMKNVSENRLSDLITRVQRGGKQQNVAAVRKAMESPTQPEKVLTRFTDLPGTLEKGGSLPFSISVPLVGTGEDSLQVTQPGVYALLINVNGVVTTSTQTFPSRIGALNLMLSVSSVPVAPKLVTESPAADQVSTAVSDVAPLSRVDASYLGSAEARTPPEGSAPIEVNMLWPVVDRPHVAADGSFLDDDLAPSLRSGGRLDTVLDVLEESRPPTGSVTLVVDPELLDELDRMSRGYVVGPTPLDLDAVAAAAATSEPEASTEPEPSTEPGVTTEPEPPAGTSGPVTTDEAATTAAATNGPSTQGAAAGPTGTATTDAPGTTAPTTRPAPVPGDAGEATVGPPVPVEGQTLGTGAADAAAYLVRLQALAAEYPVLVLPYSDPDTVALARAGMSDFLNATITRGREVAEAVLGPAASSGRPGTGLINDLSWPVDGLIDDPTAGVLRQAGIDGLVLAPAGTQGGTPNQLLTTDSGTMQLVLTDRQVSRVVDRLVTQGPGTKFPRTMNDLAAITVQLGLDGTGRTMVFTPGRIWQPDAEGVSRWFGLLGTLNNDQLAAGRSLPELAGKAVKAATLTYPDEAVAGELSAATVSKVGQVQGMAASVDQTMVTVTGAGPQPIGVLAPLVRGMYGGAAAAFRSDPVLAAKWRQPAEDALALISSKVTLLTPSSTYRLTSKSSPLILTVKNDLPFEIRVKVGIVDPERAGLQLQPPEEQLIPPLRNKQITLAATVNRTGTFMVQAQILTPDGIPWGLRTDIHLKSTAFGAFTIVMMIAAGAVLIITIAWRIGQRWRQRRERINEGLQGRGLRGPGSQDDPNTAAPKTAASPAAPSTPAGTT